MYETFGIDDKSDRVFQELTFLEEWPLRLDILMVVGAPYS